MLSLYCLILTTPHLIKAENTGEENKEETLGDLYTLHPNNEHGTWAKVRAHLVTIITEAASYMVKRELSTAILSDITQVTKVLSGVLICEMGIEMSTS